MFTGCCHGIPITTMLKQCLSTPTLLERFFTPKNTDIDPVAKAEEIYKLWYGNAVYDDLSNALGGGLDKFDLS